MLPLHTPNYTFANNSLPSALLRQRRRGPVTKILYSSSPITWYALALVTPSLKAKIGCSSYVCPGSSFHTYGQNYTNSDKTSVTVIVHYYNSILSYYNKDLNTTLTKHAAQHMQSRGRNSSYKNSSPRYSTSSPSSKQHRWYGK
jgi:hypothetical protein